jgi:hypothetical protein
MIDLAAAIEAMKSSGMTADEIVRALACAKAELSFEGWTTLCQ